MDIKDAVGKAEYQLYFEQMYNTALEGMNIGGGDEIYQSGELFVLLFLQSQLALSSPPFVIFDVGANIGNYSLAVSSIFNNIAEIYAFEPSEITYHILKKNIGYLLNAHLFNLGLNDFTGNKTLYYHEQGSGMSSVYKRNLDHMGIQFDQSEVILMITLDQFCEEHKISHIDFLKLDVEGHELSVLSGANKMIESDNIKYIQFEFGGSNIDSRTFFKDFYFRLIDRYALFRIVKDGLHPITQYRETYEIFTTTNFLAIHR